jgi:hypothetical protein
MNSIKFIAPEIICSPFCSTNLSGAINLIEFIHREFDESVAVDLSKRLVNSIRTGDMRKFKRGILHAKRKNDT